MSIMVLDGLIDHHCHGVSRTDPDRAAFEAALTEATARAPGATLFDSLLGFAVRAHCAPLLDLDRHAPPEDYLARRAQLGAEAVNRRFLRAAGAADALLDTGFGAGTLTGPAEFAELSGGRAHEVLRLESLAEDIALRGASTAGFADAVREAVAAADVVAAKTVAAYRVGLDLDPARPTDPQVRAAAGRFLSTVDRSGVDGGKPRLAEEILHRFLIWTALDAGLPVQVHAGLGDTDLDLHRADPLLLTGLLRATEPVGVPILLLHNYPYHRSAGYLAQVFAHVYCDVGLAVHNLGRRGPALLAEALELVPFGKLLFATDGAVLAELHYLGTLLFDQGLTAFLDAGIGDGSWCATDAERIAGLICGGNARRVYRMPR